MNKTVLLTILAIITFTVSVVSAEAPRWLDLTPCEVIGNNDSVCQGRIQYRRPKAFIIEHPELVDKGYVKLVPDARYEGNGRYCYPIYEDNLIDFEWVCPAAPEAFNKDKSFKLGKK